MKCRLLVIPGLAKYSNRGDMTTCMDKEDECPSGESFDMTCDQYSSDSPLIAMEHCSSYLSLGFSFLIYKINSSCFIGLCGLAISGV